MSYELWMPATWFTVTVEGLATANGTSGNVTVTCADLPITSCSNPQYGAPAYTTVWQDNLGNTIGTGNCLSGINPPSNSTVTYTATITDACGNTYTTSVTVNNTCVLPIQSLELKLKNHYLNAYLLWNVVGSDIDYYEVLVGKQPEVLHPVGKVIHRSNQNQYEWQIPLTLQKESEIYFQIKAYLNDGTTFKSNILPPVLIYHK